MPQTTLSAVPPQVPVTDPAPRPPREMQFRRVVTESLESLDGIAAVEAIMNLYCGDTAALQSRLTNALAEASTSASASRMHYDMLQSVQMAASQGLWERASMAAELATYKGILDALLSAVDRADGPTVDVTTLRAILSTEPLPVVRIPVVTAIWPDRQWRAGQFVAVEGDVTLVWAFTGWALVDHGPGAHGCIEPVFIVKDRALPRSAVEAQYRVKFEEYLPHVYAQQPAAA